MTRIRIEIELLEDLHSGSGTGHSGIDAVLACDRDNWPILRNSHVKGVWADALRAVKPDAVTKLFGASRSERGSLVMSSFYALTEPVRLTWISASREKDSRVSKDDTLKSREYIAAGTRFASLVWIPEGLEADLKLAAARADTLGARRRRGDGVIRITSWEREPLKHDTLDAAGGTHLRLLLRTVDTLCLPVTGVPGNIIPGECYIRGQQLSSAIAGALIRSGRKDDARLWFNRAIQVGNAYPLPDPALRSDAQGILPDNWQNGRVWPIPLCYQRGKPRGSSRFPWWARAVPNSVDKQADIIDCFDASEPLVHDEKTKRPGERDFLFQKYRDQSWAYYTAPLVLRMRNAVPRDNNPKGSLFTQEEIPERTRFIADINFPNSEIAQQCAKSLTTFFGAECLEVGRGGSPMLIEAAEWITGTPKDKGISQDKGELYESLEILLTSDLIARNDSLAFLETLNASALAELCGLDVESVNAVSCIAAYADTVEIHGFNALTGLPRLPALALRRGSVFRFEGPGIQIDALRNALEALNDKGLGERRWEGYGNFVLEFRDEVNTRQIVHIAQAGTDWQENALELAIQRAQEAWVDLNEKEIPIPKLVHWQRLRIAATLGEIELENRLNQFLGDCDKLGKRQHKTFVEWLLKKLNGLPLGESRILFYHQLLRLYVIHLGNQEEQQ